MTDLPIPQQCTRLIMLGHCFGVMKEAIIIGKFFLLLSQLMKKVYCFDNYCSCCFERQKSIQYAIR
jgi:hypothetical protein